MRDPTKPYTYPAPVDLHRNYGVTDYVHDVPKGSEAATPSYHRGPVHAAQYSGGIDVLHFTA